MKFSILMKKISYEFLPGVSRNSEGGTRSTSKTYKLTRLDRNKNLIGTFNRVKILKTLSKSQPLVET